MWKEEIRYAVMGWISGISLLLSSCTGTCDIPSATDSFAVSFTTLGVSVSFSTRSAVSPLSAGTTLRIMAFRRKGVLANLAVDEYIGEGIYEVPSGNSTGSLTAVIPLVLCAGTYDFYALTPALTVTSGNDSNGKVYTASVRNGMDYATSLTKSVTVSKISPSVTLDTLIRRCTKLTFALCPTGDNIAAVNISSASVTNMTDPPVNVGVGDALNVSGIARTTEVSVEGFIAPDASHPLQQSSSTVVLPREAGAFRFTMSVEYNNSGRITDLSAPLPPDLAFSAGTHYCFTVKMHVERTDLILSISPWIDADDFQSDMGGPNVIDLIIGSWTDVHWDNGNVDTGGGNTTLVVSGWEANPMWSDEFGKYPGLGVVCTTWQDVIWNSHSDTGDTNTGLIPGGWDTNHTTDGTNGGDFGENK